MPVRIKIDLSYDGTGFSGWAAQPGRRTVEDVLAQTLGRVLRLDDAPRLTVAGRTDAGVHARGQVAHTDVPEDAWAQWSLGARRGQGGQRGTGDRVGTGGTEQAPPGGGPGGTGGTGRVPPGGGSPGGRPPGVILLSRALPPDIRVRDIGQAPDGFDARFSALWRRYSYRICDDPATADPLRRQDTLWHPHRLDLAAMNAAAAELLGEHDFAAFCRRREGATTVRALRRLDWQRDAEGVVIGCVVADAFCHNMVRALVGALLPVGEGSRPPDWPSAVLAAEVRDPAVRVVSPHGLCLEEVRYPEPGQFAERAALTRRVRE